MIVIKDNFRLVSNVPNVIKLSPAMIKNYTYEENSPRHIFAFLELKRKSIPHFTNNTIFKLISNKKLRETVQVVDLEQYPLHVSYNIPTKGMITNLNPFGVKEISSLSANDLYACLVYSYAFSKLVTKKFKISESYSKHIIDFLLSMYVQLFGRKYGLLATYSSGISKLKFLLACYIYAAFFGYKNGIQLFKTASKAAPYLYNNEIDLLLKYDFSKIEDFVKALSETKVMPGINLIRFTATIHAFMKIEMLAALEDVSRFFSVLLTSNIPGARVVPTFISKYNERAYFNIIDIMRGIFK
jgi:hypothetical protein